jgi:hypothetical protein
MMVRISLALSLLLIVCPALAASAFTIDDNFHIFSGGVLDVESTLREAPRWDANPSAFGLADGVSVSVAPGFATAFGRSAADTLLLEEGLFDSFTALEDAVPDFDFDITLGGGAAEIEVFAVPDTDLAFQGNNFTGVASFFADYRSNRGLTDGTTLAGWVITGGTIHINIDRFNDIADGLLLAGILVQEDMGLHLQQLMMHEIGHMIGLEHPNEFTNANMDDDGDPTTVIPANLGPPWAGIAVSRPVGSSIMNSGLILRTNQAFWTADDLSGLNVLYPVPEPSLAGLLLVGCALASRRLSPSGSS